MTKAVERVYLLGALIWIPLTAGVFLMHKENVVAITFLYSAWANLVAGLATWQARKAERAEDRGRRERESS
jgi:hypothetical protein